MTTTTEALIEISKRLNKKITYMDMARVLGYTKQYISIIKNEELTEVQKNKLETFYKIDLSQNIPVSNESVILDYFPEVCGSCGNGVFEFSTKKSQLAVPKDSFFTRFSPVKHYFVINAYGNSMEPLIYNKDKLIIEQYEGEQIIDNQPYLFCYKDEIFIKRLVKNVDQLVIIPENKTYDIRKLSEEQLNEVDILGQVVGLMRDLRC